MRAQFYFVCLLFVGCGVATDSEQVAIADATSVESGLSRQVVYFGKYEVNAGALKSASGERIRGGQTVTLKLFLPELGGFLCGDYCFAVGPHLFVRFQGDGGFQEMKGLPSATYIQRGPYVTWPNDGVADVSLSVPNDADRIEVFMRFDRISWNGYTCFLGYDIPECPDTLPISDAYLSNFAHNFSIPVN